MLNTDYYHHIYNRGAHKVPIFHDSHDYERFLQLLYIGNSTTSFHLSNLKKRDIYTIDREETLVQIVSYCLMPNHFHLVLKEDTVKGITRFIRKICTGYSMYYNLKYLHSGTIFQGKYKSKVVTNDDYLRTLIQYVHLNPFGIEEPFMTKEAKKEYLAEAINYSKKYEYSSFKDYLREKRPQNNIISRSDLDISITSPPP